MDSGLRETELAAYNSRSRVVRDGEGMIHLFWGALSVRMSQGEFLDFARLVAEAACRMARCGELACSSCGRVVRCSMGQISLSYGRLTLWFDPEEFDAFERLAATARQRLSDAAPLPPLGLPWRPRQGPVDLN
jgi:hypothetical protein